MPRLSFPPADAGVYSGISVLSNALYLPRVVLIWIVLPASDHREPTPQSPLTADRLLAAWRSWPRRDGRGVPAPRSAFQFFLGRAFAGQGDVLIHRQSVSDRAGGSNTLCVLSAGLRDGRRALLLAGCVFLPTVAAPAIFLPGDTAALIATCSWRYC